MGSLIKDLKAYTTNSLICDLLAGATVAIILIPQGMAYALMAGFPPIYGLYAALVPILIYPFLGSSRYLSVGPVALVSIIVLSGLSEFASPMSSDYIRLAILVSFIAGAIQIALSVFKLGFLVNFLSQPVISGFTSAAAFIIIFSQVKYILGVEPGRVSNIIETIKRLIQELPNTNLMALAIGVIALIIILVIKKIKRTISGALIVVLAGIGLVYFTNLDQRGLDIVGSVPSGLPTFMPLAYTYDEIIMVLPLALVVCVISFIESLAIAKTLASKQGTFDISADKELLALGLAKVGGAFFQAFPNTGSFSRSAVNEEAGAKSGLASIFAGLFIGATLLYFTRFFYYLPKAVLGAIVISAVFNLIEFKEALHLYKTHRGDFFVFLVTFVLTLLLGVQHGVLAGIVLSLLILIAKVSKPHYAILGELADNSVYRNVDRFTEALTNTHRLIFRYDDDIYFGNAQHFFGSVLKEINKKDQLKELLLDFSSVSSIDSTGYKQLILLAGILKSKQVDLHICSIKGPVRDYFAINNIDELVPEKNKHWDIKSALKKLDNL